MSFKVEWVESPPPRVRLTIDAWPLDPFRILITPEEAGRLVQMFTEVLAKNVGHASSGGSQ
jgi:hypothetical protein